MKKRAIGVGLIIVLLMIFSMTEINGGYAAAARYSVKDLASRTVNVPSKPQKISCLHPIPSYMVWRLSPGKLISIDMVFKTRLYLMPDSEIARLKSLPVTGVYFKGMNREQMLMLKPDVIVSMTKDPNLDREEQEYMAPVVAVSKDELSDYETSFRFIGKLVGNEKEGNALADYWRDTIHKITSITDKIASDKRVKVYYASHDGVKSTVGPKTVMASIVRMAGGITLYDVVTNPVASSAEDEHILIGMEEILRWNPDVIITKTASERDEILSGAEWKPIPAVKNRRVYASLKYETLDGLQSLMGLLWTAGILHPDKFKINFVEETKSFYSKFYCYEKITTEEIWTENN